MPRNEALRALILSYADQIADELFRLSDSIFRNPEPGFKEYKAVELLTGFLRTKGFEVKTGCAGLETAFVAAKRGGQRGPSIAFVAEYDALPEIGHGCGHNMIGTAACGAAASVASVMDRLDGAVYVIGCPAEEGAVEGAGGKVFLVEAGYFDHIDAAMMVHPASRYVVAGGSLARVAVAFSFECGEPSRALDAANLTFNAINSLRQQLPPGVKIHGVLKCDGAPSGTAPRRAKIRLYVRGATLKDLHQAEDRVKRCAEGAARVTGVRVEFRYTAPKYQNLIPNRALGEAFASNLRALGVRVDETDDSGAGSTDMGNVSHVVPCIHPYIAVVPRGVAGHTKEFGESTLTKEAHAGMLIGVKAMALTAFDLLSDPLLLKAVREEFSRNFKTSTSAPSTEY